MQLLEGEYNMLKSYCKDIETVEYKGKEYIKSRPVAYRMKNVLDLNKQKILLFYFWDAENNSINIVDNELFSKICSKLCIRQTKAIEYLKLREILYNHKRGNAKSVEQRKYVPKSIKELICIDTDTGKVTRAHSVSRLSQITGVSATSIYRAVNEGIEVKNYRILARHYSDSIITR